MCAKLVRSGGCTAVIFGVWGLVDHVGAAPVTLDFNGLGHGDIIFYRDDNNNVIEDGTTFQSQGVTIAGVNVAKDFDMVAVFDSAQNPQSQPDLDLQGPPWSGGNLPTTTHMGRMLIINEHDHYFAPINADGEGERPAGSIFFDFDEAITEIGFDLIDIEDPEEYGQDSGFAASFFMGSTEIGRVAFGEMTMPKYGSATFGNNTINRITPISFESAGAPLQFDRVDINMGGSGAVDNIRWDRTFQPSGPVVPEPVSSVLVTICLGALVPCVRRRRF